MLDIKALLYWGLSWQGENSGCLLCFAAGSVCPSPAAPVQQHLVCVPERALHILGWIYQCLRSRCSLFCAMFAVGRAGRTALLNHWRSCFLWEPGPGLKMARQMRNANEREEEREALRKELISPLAFSSGKWQREESPLLLRVYLPLRLLSQLLIAWVTRWLYIPCPCYSTPFLVCIIHFETKQGWWTKFKDTFAYSST